MHTKQDRNNQWTIACVWNKKNLGVASQIARWWPLNPVHWFQWRLEQRGRCSHKPPINSKTIKLNMNVQMLAVTHYLSCSISEATTNLSCEPERSWMMVASWLSVCIFFFINWRNGVSHCANRPSRTLTGLVELLGRLSSPLQPGGIEVAPFVLGFISTAAGASGRRRRRWWRLNRETGRHFGLPLVQAEQPRHFNENR